MIHEIQVTNSELNKENLDLTFSGIHHMTSFTLVFHYVPGQDKNNKKAVWVWDKNASTINNPMMGTMGSEILINQVTGTANKNITIQRLEQILPPDQYEPIYAHMLAEELLSVDFDL